MLYNARVYESRSPFLLRPPLGSLLLGLSFCLMASLTPSTGAAERDRPLHIAVASNFRAAAIEVGQLFEAQSGTPVTLSSAASGMLAAQILEGAPFDLFLSADEVRARAVIGTGEGRDEPICYARGSLVLLGADDLNAALTDASLSVAIGNPRSAPYGVAADAVLRREGFAGPEQRRIVQGANVQQALQFFERGATDLALVAKALSSDQGIDIPAAWHPPIDQFAVVIARDGRAARAREFLTFLRSESVQSLLGDLGYQRCS